MDMFERDPEEVGPESEEDLWYRMNFIESIHEYEPDGAGKCQHCGSTQRSSVLHDDPEAEFRSRHYHGGGDCMCFEDEDGPSFYGAMQKFVKGR